MLVMEIAPSRLHNIGSPECIEAPNGIYMPMDLKFSDLNRQAMPGVRHEAKSMESDPWRVPAGPAVCVCRPSQ